MGVMQRTCRACGRNWMHMWKLDVLNGSEPYHTLGGRAMCKNTLCIHNAIPFLETGNFKQFFRLGVMESAYTGNLYFQCFVLTFEGVVFIANRFPNLRVCCFYSDIMCLLPTRPALAIPRGWRKRVWAEGTNCVGVLACRNVSALGLMQWIPISHCRLCKPICFPGSTHNQS